jgi:5S rRNA maturation endonuclease (ribonuclease M5)
MKKKELTALLYKLGIQPLDESDGWIKVSCPLSETNHLSKQDNNPSAGFKINDNGPSVFHCFVCGTRSIESILNTYKWKKGVDVIGEYLKHEIPEQEESIEYREKFQKKKDPVPVPNEVLNLFKPLKFAKAYLENRGIGFEIARQHGLLYCDNFQTAEGKTWKNAILVPIKDLDYKTYWIHFRSIDNKFFWHGKPSHFKLHMEWGREDSFFGMQFLDITKPVVLVEGAFDCLRLKTLGLENVIATHGGISHKSKKIQRLKNFSVISGFDSDKAGDDFHRAVERFFQKEIPRLDWKKVGAKDPGELKSREDLETVLNTNKLNPRFRDKWRFRL